MFEQIQVKTLLMVFNAALSRLIFTEMTNVIFCFVSFIMCCTVDILLAGYIEVSITIVYIGINLVIPPINMPFS